MRSQGREYSFSRPGRGGDPVHYLYDFANDIASSNTLVVSSIRIDLSILNRYFFSYISKPFLNVSQTCKAFSIRFVLFSLSSQPSAVKAQSKLTISIRSN